MGLPRGWRQSVGSPANVDTGGGRLRGLPDPIDDSEPATKSYAAAHGGGGVLTDPTTIDGLALWLDASQLSLSDNDPVATWPDLSGNGYDATAPQRIFALTVIATGGTYQLQYASGDPTTDPIAFDASAADVLAAIAATGEPIVSVTLESVEDDTRIYHLIHPPAWHMDNSPGSAWSTITDDLTPHPGSDATIDELQETHDVPVFVADEQNGLGVVRFDRNSEQWLGFSGAALDMTADKQGVTIFAVSSGGGGNAESSVFTATLEGDDTQVRWGFAVYASGTFVLYVPGGSINSQSPDSGDGDELWAVRWAVVESTIDSAIAGWSFAMDNRVINGLNGGTVIPDSPSQAMWTGKDPWGGYADIDLGELLVFTRSLSPRERRSVNEYLSDKWGTL